MTAADPSSGSTRYGVVTCGKQAPAPMDLGPCRLEPGHDTPCRWAALGGYVTITEGPPLDVDPVIARYRRYTRRTFHIAAAATVVMVASTVWSVVQILTR